DELPVADVPAARQEVEVRGAHQTATASSERSRYASTSSPTRTSRSHARRSKSMTSSSHTHARPASRSGARSPGDSKGATNAARELALLEGLQDRPSATGRELAARLHTDVRTIRRDVAALRALGIPVEGERGRGGSYRLKPGFRVPPLMFTTAEATAVTLG